MMRTATVFPNARLTAQGRDDLLHESGCISDIDGTLVVKGAQMAPILASDWFSWLLTGSATADRGLLRGSRAQNR